MTFLQIPAGLINQIIIAYTYLFFTACRSSKIDVLLNRGDAQMGLVVLL